MVSESSLKSMCRDAGVKKGIYENSRFIFTIQQVANFYFYDNIGVNDISDGFVDGCGDGGIDYIYKNEDDNELYLIQGKTNKQLSQSAIHEIFNYIERTVDAVRKNDVKKLKLELVEKLLDTLDSDPKIHLVLFFKNKLNPELKEIEKYSKKGYEIEIKDSEDIENQMFLNDPNKKVDKYEIEIDSHNNVLRYEKNGYIVNIKANSLKKLYIQKLYKGLFSYNLREKIAGLKVDNNIKETINNEHTNFWYKNNGITIGCEKCEIRENTLILKNFSIINGAQTTTNIGRSEKVKEGYDFLVPCKIVIVPKNSMENAKEYLQSISIATNYQKPISLQDIHANCEEQQKLRNGALANDLKLNIKVKRSEEQRKDSLKKWQHIDNLTLGQIILSCIFQNPGAAKSSKNSLMSTYYDIVYKKKEHNYDLYYDMVMLYNRYYEFRNAFKKAVYNNEQKDKIPNSDSSEVNSIIQEGMWTILACIFYINKLNNKKTNPDDGECGFKERIFNVDDYNDIDSKIDELFKYLAETINTIFKREKTNGAIKTEYSSYFLKNNTNYEKYIKKEIETIYNSDTAGKQLRGYLDIFK